MTTNLVRRPRDQRLDALRGVAIVGVVFGHVVRGLMGADLANADYGVGLINERVIYQIRLPLFVLISGLLMSTSVEKRGTKGYLAARLLDVGWAYLLWTFLQGGVEVITSPWKNTPTTWEQVLTLWVPLAQLWYLPYLMIISVGIALIKPWRNRTRLWIGLLVGFAVSFAGWGHDGHTVLTRGMSLTIFIVIGAAMERRRIFALWDRTPRWVHALVAVAGLTISTAVGLHTDAIMPTSHNLIPWSVAGVLLGLLGAATGVIGVSSLVVLLCSVSTPFRRFFAFLGRHAMAIYLGHITAMAAVRIVLLRMGMDNVAVHVILGTTIGTLACLLIVLAAKWLPWLLVAPRWMHQLVVPKQAIPRRGGGELSQSEAHQTARRADG